MKQRFVGLLMGLIVLSGTGNAHQKNDVEEVFQELVHASDWREAKDASQRLGEFGEKAFDVIRRGATYEKEQVRRYCYELLMQKFADNERARATIMNDGLADKNDSIRYMCAFFLGEHKVYSAFRRLKNLMEDEPLESLSRYAAAKSLAELGESGVIEVLYEAAGNNYFMPRYLSNLGLKALTGKDLNDFEGYDYHEGAFVSGGRELIMQRRPIEDSERRAKRFLAIAAYCRWLKEAKPEIYKHLAPKN
jgi:hypothetical protein